MCECRDEFNAVELVVVIVVMNLEVMKLKLLLCHSISWLLNLTIKVFHYVPSIRQTTSFNLYSECNDTGISFTVNALNAAKD